MTVSFQVQVQVQVQRKYNIDGTLQTQNNLIMLGTLVWYMVLFTKEINYSKVISSSSRP
jgi:hypothetical protein